MTKALPTDSLPTITRSDRLRRRGEAFFDRIRMRPLGFLVFGGSVAALLFMQFGSLTQVKAPAVATARAFEHPSAVESVVAEVHVKTGEWVESGQPLVTLSSRDLGRQLAVLDAELDRMEKRSLLELARISETHRSELNASKRRLEDARRDLEVARSRAVEPSQKVKLADGQEAEVSDAVKARTRRAEDLLTARWQLGLAKAESASAKRRVKAEGDHVEELEALAAELPPSPPLQQASAALFAAELELLRVRRSELLADLETLTIVARDSGRVADVLERGAAVLKGASVASLMPARADEIVAYVPADTSPKHIAADTMARITAPYGVCDEPGQVRRVGAFVEEAPGQIRSFLQFPIYGLPVYISVPDSCELGVGQLLSVEFNKVLR